MIDIKSEINNQRIQQLRGGLLCIDGEVSSRDPFWGDFRLVHYVTSGDRTSLYQVLCVFNEQGGRITDFGFYGHNMPLEEATNELREFYIATYRPGSGVYWQRWFGPDQVSVLDTATLNVLSPSSPLVSQLLFRIHDLLGAAGSSIRRDIDPVRCKLRVICKESCPPLAQLSRTAAFR